METGNYWKLFESTGLVEAYLAYKHLGQQAGAKENHDADHNDGAGAAGHQDGRS